MPQEAADVAPAMSNHEIPSLEQPHEVAGAGDGELPVEPHHDGERRRRRRGRRGGRRNRRGREGESFAPETTAEPEMDRADFADQPTDEAASVAPPAPEREPSPIAHGEASSEKQGIGFFCDGRASLVVGTHTHVPTADHQILNGGTAYMTDAGMTGDYDSIIGMQKEEPLRRFTTGIPSGRFEPAAGVATLSGVAVETDDATGLALRVAPVRAGGRLEPAVPGFWM